MRKLTLLVSVLLIACADKLDENKRAELLRIRTDLGAGYLERNQLDIANQELQKAFAINSNDSQANNIMGLLQARMKNYDKADKYFRKAISAQPDNSDAQNNYGVFLCEQGKLDEAEQRFKAALTNPLYKTPELANLNAGLCLMKKPAAAQAVKYFKVALEVNPKLAPALYQMAKISLDSGQALSARGYMQRYFEVARESPESLLLAANIERALGNKDMQAHYALRLTAQYPDSLEAKQLKQSRLNDR
ncbi:MAG TPA: type IV pilus biogenesis/stability protein PilW [Acidiferrobacterales bacterium]|nr:type IV pilus biogenesis/stability protein PilW [Acidiferrobacterales bacterium]